MLITIRLYTTLNPTAYKGERRDRGVNEKRETKDSRMKVVTHELGSYDEGLIPIGIGWLLWYQGVFLDAVGQLIDQDPNLNERKLWVLKVVWSLDDRQTSKLFGRQLLKTNVVPQWPTIETRPHMLQAPIEGYEDAIVIPPINANNFELKQPLINLVQSNKFTGRQDPHNHPDCVVCKEECEGHASTCYETLQRVQNTSVSAEVLAERICFFADASRVELFSDVSTDAPLSNSSSLLIRCCGDVTERFRRHYSRTAIGACAGFIRGYSAIGKDGVKSIGSASRSYQKVKEFADIKWLMFEFVEHRSLCGWRNCVALRALASGGLGRVQETGKSAKSFRSNLGEDINAKCPDSLREGGTEDSIFSLGNVAENLKREEFEEASSSYIPEWDGDGCIALVECPKFNNWLSSLLRNKEKLRRSLSTTVNAECSAIIMNKVPEKLEDPGKFLIPCALQELDRTSALADSGASINLLPHSIYKKLGLEALTPTRMTLELANRSITHPMGIAEDVVVRVDGFTFLADFVVVNFEPDPRVPIILGRPFLRTAKALIDLYEETLTLRVGKEELVYYADKSKKNKDKHFVHAISVIDFSKDDPFSGSTTTHSDDPSPSSSPVKTSDNLEEFADELTLLKKDVQEGNFQDHSNPLFEFDDNFKSSTINPLFDEMEEDVEIKNSNVSDEPVLLNTPLSDKVECFTPEDDIDEIDAFLAIEVSSNFEEGYFDSEGDVTFLDNLLSDDTTHNLASEVISDHEPEQNESSITFSPRSDPLHHEFAGEENVHQSSVIESLPVSPIPVEDSEPVQEEIDIFLVPDDLIPPGVENDDSESEDEELSNFDYQDDPSIPRPPPEPPDVEKCFEPEAVILITKVFKGVSKPHDFMIVILPTLVSDLTFILFLPLFFSFGSEDAIFDLAIVTFLEPVAFSMEVPCSKIEPTISEASRVRCCIPFHSSFSSFV
ncbi:reverse transcriptase domain-containing protein [Tanacetum coccineum]|uniref:Reverse transcriptase domain-containing protein n=1 Tax=Tanacetum coccineum TaxID=301880 RepID=A0ABQ5EKI1_9ASTR